MSKLDELIQKLCPNGVEWKTIKETVGLNRGSRLVKNQLSDDFEYEVYHGSKDTLLGKYDNFNAPANTTIVVNTGGIGGVKFIDKPFWCSDGSFWLGHCESINDKFLYYCLAGYEDYFASKKRVGGVPTIDRDVVESFKIPVPPMEVQCEIVHILDQFTLLTAELTAELTARKQQYEYYRKELLSFDNNVKRLKIKDVFTRLKGTPITAGKMKEIEDINGEVKIFAGGKTQIFAKEIDIPNANITRVPAVLVQSRGVIDFIYYAKSFTFKNEMWAYTCKNNTTLKFLYYVLKENVNYFRESSSGMGAMPQISLAVTEDFEISLPSLEEQQRIVDILDKFDTYCNDLTQGLPAEIELRKQQYEYYRDKLLSFKELK